MKKIFKALKFTSFLLFIILAIVACDQDFNSIESDVIGLKNFNTGSYPIPITSYNKKLDSLRINNLSANLLGVYNDPVYGQTKASIITQITPTEFDSSFGDNPVIDSVILTIPYYNKTIADSTDVNGNAVYSAKVSGLTVDTGKNGIIGKSVVIHRDPDDYKSQPAGNSGPRIACGLIK